MRIPNAFSVINKISTFLLVPSSTMIYIKGVAKQLLMGYAVVTVITALALFFLVPEGFREQPWSYWYKVLIIWIVAGGIMSLRFTSYAQMRPGSRPKNDGKSQD